MRLPPGGKRYGVCRRSLCELVIFQSELLTSFSFWACSERSLVFLQFLNSGRCPALVSWVERRFHVSSTAVTADHPYDHHVWR